MFAMMEASRPVGTEEGLMPHLPFPDRAAAGELLAQVVAAELDRLSGALATAPTIVYALPRGGLPVAAPVAQKLGCPMDIIVAKKIAQPANPELALGAVAADGEVVWTQPEDLPLDCPDELEADLKRALDKASYQQSQLTLDCPHPNPQGAIALLVDDGIATGMTIAAATKSLRSRGKLQASSEELKGTGLAECSPHRLGKPAAIWICAPVAPPSLMSSLMNWCDRAIVLETPHPFVSVSRFYKEFAQVEMDEARQYLQRQRL